MNRPMILESIDSSQSPFIHLMFLQAGPLGSYYCPLSTVIHLDPEYRCTPKTSARFAEADHFGLFRFPG